MTIGLAKDEDLVYYSKDKSVYSEKELLFTMDGNVLSLLYYNRNLLVMFKSLYNHYSVAQYDLVQKRIVKTVEGGHISGPPIYSCIYGDEIYISASTNNKISLSLFDLPGQKGKEEKPRPRSIFPMFELNKIDYNFLTDKVSINTEKIKDLNEYPKADTNPAKNSLIRYHVWLAIFLFIVTVFVLAFFFKENSVLPVFMLSILFIGLSYIIKNSFFI